MGLYLGLRTDSPVAEFYFYDGEQQLATESWQADRELAKQLLSRLEAFLSANGTTFKHLNGLFVYRGPGSFTGLRIGITVMNSTAYALQVPIVGSEGDAWCPVAVKRLIESDNDEMVMPLYGSEARITKPKK